MDKLNRHLRKTLGYATYYDLIQHSLKATEVTQAVMQFGVESAHKYLQKSYFIDFTLDE